MNFIIGVMFLSVIFIEIVPLFKEKNIKDAVKTSIILLISIIPSFLLVNDVSFKTPLTLIYELFVSLGIAYPQN